MIKNQSIQTEEMTIGEMLSKRIEKLKNEYIPALDEDECKNDSNILTGVLDIIDDEVCDIQDCIDIYQPINRQDLIYALEEVVIELDNRGYVS